MQVSYTVINGQSLRVRLHAQDLAQQLTAASVYLERLAMIPKLPMADHQSAIKVFRCTVELNPRLIHVRRFLPAPSSFVGLRGISKRAQELAAQCLPRHDRPRLIGFLLQKMTLVQVPDPGKTHRN